MGGWEEGEVDGSNKHRYLNAPQRRKGWILNAALSLAPPPINGSI